jgi:hypothetical protein
VRSELRLLLALIKELDCAAISHTLKPIRTPLDDILVPFAQAEAIHAELRAVVPHDALDCLVLAWHHEHLVYQSRSQPKRYPHQERDFWLACAEGLVGNEFDTLKALVFDKLDSIVRASSLVEMVNALIRPYLNSCKGQITQETLTLIMFYHHHRRYKSGKRQGKAPIEILTGEPFEVPWWELLRQQVNREEDTTDHGALPSSPPRQLMVNDDGHTDQQAMAPCPALVEHPGASGNDHRQTLPQAAYSFPLGWTLGPFESLAQGVRLCLHPARPEV